MAAPQMMAVCATTQMMAVCATTRARTARAVARPSSAELMMPWQIVAVCARTLGNSTRAVCQESTSTASPHQLGDDGSNIGIYAADGGASRDQHTEASAFARRGSASCLTVLKLDGIGPTVNVDGNALSLRLLASRKASRTRVERTTRERHAFFQGAPGVFGTCDRRGQFQSPSRGAHPCARGTARAYPIILGLAWAA